jgi:hypothetical protein
LIIKSRALLVFFTALAIIAYLSLLLQKRRLRRLYEERVNENICSFARSYNLHDIDPRIIRAVYEELIPYCSFREGNVPIRPSDTFETFGIEGEELDELAVDVASRTGRSMENPVTNPFFGKVRTIDDLIRFISEQPVT